MTIKGFAKLADPDFVLDTRPVFGPSKRCHPKTFWVDPAVLAFLTREAGK